MKRIEHCANISIGRACLFALFGTSVFMLALVPWPLTALRAGAYCCALTAATLLYRAHRAPHLPYKRTETWVLMGKSHGLPEERAQSVISGVLRQVYLRFATYSASLASGFLVLALFARVAGVKA